MKELNTQQKIILTLTFSIIIFIAVYLLGILNKVTDPNPPHFEEEEREGWYPTLSASYWVIDEVSKNTRLKELAYSTISAIQFSEYDGFNNLSLTLYGEAINYYGELSPGGNTLCLDVDGAPLELWYSISENKTFPTVTIKGQQEKLFFVKEEWKQQWETIISLSLL